MTTTEREQLEAQCPLRPGEPCALCQVGAADPRDCGLVYLVMHDDELREGLRRHTAAAAGCGR